MRTAQVLLGLGVSALVVFQGLSLRSQRAELAALQGAVEALQAKESQPRAAAVAPVVSWLLKQPTRERSEPPPATAPPTAPPQRKEEAPPPPEEPLELRTELRFQHETADPDWALAAQRTAREKLQALVPDQANLRAVDCHSSLCRIEVMHQSRDSLRRYLERIVGDPQGRPWNAGVVAADPQDAGAGQLLSVLYLAREGRQLTSE